MQEEQLAFQGLDYPCFKLIDYCRYVDDMRLVVVNSKSNADPPLELLKDILHRYSDASFNKLDLGISLNKHKTKVTTYRGKYGRNI